MTTKQKELLMTFGEDLVDIFNSELSLEELPFEIMSYIERED